MSIDASVMDKALGVLTGKSPEVDGVVRPMTCNMRDLLKMLSISRSMIYEKINPRSRYFDPTFPRPFSLEGRRNYWLTREVHAYIEQKAGVRKTGGAV